MTFTHALATNNYGCAKFIVDASAANGTHTTIASAISSASSGDTIFVRPGTYTENLTLKVGVNLAAYECDAFTPNVTISGTCTLTTAGTVSISGIRLQTNNAFAIAVTGSSASILNLINCHLNFSNNTGISYTTSSASSEINIITCNGTIGTTLIKFYEISGSGSLFFDRSYIDNPGNSVTASTSSSGNVYFQYTYFEAPITTSGTGTLAASFSFFSTFPTNTLILTQGGSSSNLCRSCIFKSGSATSITISTGLNLQDCQFELSNADVISGAGTLTYSMLTVNNTVTWGMSVTTKVVRSNGPDMTIGGSTSGGSNTFIQQNESNTANSHAVIKALSGGSSSGDARFSASTSTTEWSFGADNSVTTPTADPFVISQGAALGTNNVMSVATSGEINYPLQPAFLAFLGTTDSNVTGDGDFWLLGQGNALTEVFDQNGDFATSGLFTAPVTGRYFMGGTVYVGGLTSAMTTGYMQISASNRAFDSFYVNSFAAGTAGNQIMMNLSCFVDMDAADTVGCYVRIQSGTQVADVIGAANCDTSFFGYLVC